MPSLKPSEFTEGGAVPFDRDLLWRECRFVVFQYTQKDGSPVMKDDDSGPVESTAIRVLYVDDDGAEYTQHYSVADPARFLPSEDGKTLEAQDEAVALSKSSNGFILLNALVNAGFPENKLGDYISVLDGLRTHNIAVPEPKRTGLKTREREGGRERVLSVPSRVLQLPWEGEGAKGAPKKGAGKKAEPKKAPAQDTGATDEDNLTAAVDLVLELLAEKDSVTRQQVATAAIRAKKPAVGKVVFTADFTAAVEDAGCVVDGETISLPVE